MIEKICEVIVCFFIRQIPSLEEKREVLVYGCDVILSDIVNLIVVLIVGILFGTPLSGILFFCPFAVLREHTGGYHADTHLKCNIVLAINVMLVLCFYSALKTRTALMSGIVIAGSVVSEALICVMAPKEHKNKPLSLSEKKHHKTIGIIIGLILMTVSFVCLLLDQYRISFIVFSVLMSASIALFF